MNKRIITKYNKLNRAIKQAINNEFPNGIDHQLSRMKHIIKGYFFDGFTFNYGDTTYLIEWSEDEYQHSFNIYNDDYEGEEGENELELAEEMDDF